MTLDAKQKDRAPDPATKYGSPENLVRDPAALPDAKRMMLRQWQRDLLQLMTASEENMPPQRGGSEPPASDAEIAELLQRVSNCLAQLKQQYGQEKKASEKPAETPAGKRDRSAKRRK